MGNGPLPFRGGNWNNGAYAGVFALNLSNPRSNANNNIGFRSALPYKPEGEHPTGWRTEHRDKGAHYPPQVGKYLNSEGRLVGNCSKNVLSYVLEVRN